MHLISRIASDCKKKTSQQRIESAFWFQKKLYILCFFFVFSFFSRWELPFFFRKLPAKCGSIWFQHLQSCMHQLYTVFKVEMHFSPVFSSTMSVSISKHYSTLNPYLYLYKLFFLKSHLKFSVLIWLLFCLTQEYQREHCFKGFGSYITEANTSLKKQKFERQLNSSKKVKIYKESL